MKTPDYSSSPYVHQNLAGAFGIAASISDEGEGHPANNIDLLAVASNNASDLAVTTFVLP
jgi:hypothetical protein